MKKKISSENNKKQIVFFCATTPYVMIYKIAREFKKRNYETILITISQRDKWDPNWYKDGFDKIICSNFQMFKPTIKNSFNMLRRIPYLIKSIYEMKKLNPYAVFAVARPNYITAMAMKFFKKCPIIYFPYDISSQECPNLETALKEGRKSYEINAERYCFENADGILHKGAPDELKHLRGESMLGNPVKITPLQICFHPYCSDEFIVPINKNKLSKTGGEIHIVYVGGVFFDDKQFEFLKDLFKKLLKQKIHIHVYSKIQHISKEDDMRNLNFRLSDILKNKYFHIEFALDPRKLIYEISKYDFGLFQGDPTKPKYRKDYLFYTGNKISSYLEAGIPLILIYSENSIFISEIIKKYRIGLPIKDYPLEIDDINKKVKKLNFRKLEKNLDKARKDFNMTRHFPRLERFVYKVVERKNKIQNQVVTR